MLADNLSQVKRVVGTDAHFTVLLEALGTPAVGVVRVGMDLLLNPEMDVRAEPAETTNAFHVDVGLSFAGQRDSPGRVSEVDASSHKGLLAFRKDAVHAARDAGANGLLQQGAHVEASLYRVSGEGGRCQHMLLKGTTRAGGQANVEALPRARRGHNEKGRAICYHLRR
jgi:hypothetical protein